MKPGSTLESTWFALALVVGGCLVFMGVGLVEWAPASEVMEKILGGLIYFFGGGLLLSGLLIAGRPRHSFGLEGGDLVIWCRTIGRHQISRYHLSNILRVSSRGSVLEIALVSGGVLRFRGPFSEHSDQNLGVLSSIASERQGAGA